MAAVCGQIVLSQTSGIAMLLLLKNRRNMKMKKLRMSINIGMTVVLISLMSYSLIGEFTHEILGTAMVVLFTVHHMLNWRWFGTLTKGRYRVFRIFQTILVFC